MEEAIYKKEDFKRISWEEYGEILEDLNKKTNNYLDEKKLKITAIVPILRAAAFPGTFLTYKLKTCNILPIQYKYYVEKGEYVLKRLTDFPRVDFEIPEKPIFLLVENNTCFGTTAEEAGKYLKKKFPKCEIIFVATTCDISYKKPQIFKKVIIGKETNECRTLGEKEVVGKGISNHLLLFPWENLEEEFAAVSAEEYKYN